MTHPDDTLHRLAALVILAAYLTGERQDTSRRRALELARAVTMARRTSSVIPFPTRPDRPGSAA